jgi:hypothetical protein
MFSVSIYIEMPSETNGMNVLCFHIMNNWNEYSMFSMLYVFIMLLPLSFSRSPSKRYRRTIGAASRDAIGMEERRFIDGYRPISKSQTFSGQSEHSHYGFNRHDAMNSHARSTLPHDYKTSRGSWSSRSQQSEKTDE